MITPISPCLNLELCEEVKVNYPILFPNFITHSDGDKVILVLPGDLNALECLERDHIHTAVGAPDLLLK